jgi:hypothetical protein
MIYVALSTSIIADILHTRMSIAIGGGGGHLGVCIAGRRRRVPAPGRGQQD